MADAGISVGGAGGAGGLDPTNKPGGIGDAGQASESDVTSFQESMGGGAEAGGTGTVEAGSPFDMQANRVTDSGSVSGPGMGEAVMKDLGNLISSGQTQGAELMEKLKSMGEGGWSTADAMEFQYMAGEMNLMTEVISKGVNKTVQAAQSTVKNQ